MSAGLGALGGGGVAHASLLEKIARTSIDDDNILRFAMQVALEARWEPAMALSLAGRVAPHEIRSSGIVEALQVRVSVVYEEFFGGIEASCRSWLSEGLRFRSEGKQIEADQAFNCQKVASKVDKVRRALEAGQIQQAGRIMSEEGFDADVTDQALFLLRAQITVYTQQRVFQQTSAAAHAEAVVAHHGDSTLEDLTPGQSAVREFVLGGLASAAKVAAKGGAPKAAKFFMDATALTEGLENASQAIAEEKFGEALGYIKSFVLPSAAMWARIEARESRLAKQAAEVLNAFLQAVPAQVELYEAAILFYPDKEGKVAFILKQANILAQLSKPELAARVLAKGVEYHDNASTHLMQLFINGLTPPLQSGGFLHELQAALDKMEGDAAWALAGYLSTWRIEHSEEAAHGEE